MSHPIQAIRGMKDILPVETPNWHFVEAAVQAVLDSYGYEEIRLPILEHTAVFDRIGDHTDIVEKEMYTFDDRNGDRLSLRPEGTAGCVRAGVEHGLLYNQIQRLWYQGPMFRHERPQKGRYRQFHQIGVEAFGMTGPDVDAELVAMTARIWRRLGLDGVRLEINSIGTSAARAAYRQHLVEYFSPHRERLDADCERRLHTNPLRILDSKNPDLQVLIAGAPNIAEFLDPESVAHFEAFQELLKSLAIDYVVNTRLVRGLDYYNKTVFEWTTDRLGAQGTICGGGRYDGLVDLFGGKPTPACGFAMGIERLVALLEQGNPPARLVPHAYLITVDVPDAAVLSLTEQLRDAVPALRLIVNCGGGGFKAQFKRADRSGALVALIVGADELANNTVGLKFMREDRAQVVVPRESLPEYLRQALAQREIPVK